MNIEEVTSEDKVAMAQAYRFYQMLDCSDQDKIPKDFVDMLETFGDFEKVEPFKNVDEALKSNLNEKANFLIMYMCTFA